MGSGAEQPIGGVHREVHEPQAGVAPRLSNPASKPLTAGEDTVLPVKLNTASAASGEAMAACRGLRAWRVNQTPFGSMEARQSPAALNTRAKRGGQPDDKKGGPKESRESDRFIVAQGNPAQAGPTCVKGTTEQRSLHRQPVRYE